MSLHAFTRVAAAAAMALGLTQAAVAAPTFLGDPPGEWANPEHTSFDVAELMLTTGTTSWTFQVPDNPDGYYGFVHFTVAPPITGVTGTITTTGSVSVNPIWLQTFDQSTITPCPGGQGLCYGFVAEDTTPASFAFNTLRPDVYKIEFYGSGAGTLSIAFQGVSPVPEPASMAMMLAGLGAVGAAARRRKSQDATQAR